jgi:cell division septum initiation protein DivIVA
MGVLTGVLFLIIGGAMMLYAVYLAGRRHNGADMEATQREAQAIVEDARTKAELIIKEAELKAKDLLVEVRAQAEREVREQHRELTALESKLAARE